MPRRETARRRCSCRRGSESRPAALSLARARGAAGQRGRAGGRPRRRKRLRRGGGAGVREVPRGLAHADAGVARMPRHRDHVRELTAPGPARRNTASCRPGGCAALVEHAQPRPGALVAAVRGARVRLPALPRHHHPVEDPPAAAAPARPGRSMRGPRGCWNGCSGPPARRLGMVTIRTDADLSPAEADAVQAAYAGAQVILEYGSGGSTVLAAAMPGKTVFSVESDPAWARGLDAQPQALSRRRWCATPTSGRCRTGASPCRGRRAPLPQLSPGDLARAGVRAPGRGAGRRAVPPRLLRRGGDEDRAAGDAVLRRLWTRPQYAEVERLAAPVELVGRMARFELAPGPVPKKHFDWIVGTYLEPDYARASGLVRTARKLFGGA